MREGLHSMDVASRLKAIKVVPRIVPNSKYLKKMLILQNTTEIAVL
jgi:hypothetical protein